jgi:hypothetical protein
VKRATWISLLNHLRLENVPENFNESQYLQIYDGRFILIDENRETPKCRFYKIECIGD